MEDQFLKIAKQAALEAGKIIKKYSTQAYQKNIKHDDLIDFATDADLEAEKKIIEILTEEFPEHNIIAEESGRQDKGSEYSWAIDPLDGTLTFSLGIPYFTTSIGLLKKDKPFLGVINQIGFDNLYWAESGKGAFMNGKKIAVSKKNILADMVGTLETGHRANRGQKMDRYVSRMITKIGYPYQFGSAAVTLALIAYGTLDLYISEAYLWDFAAGTVIVQEAGGKVTDFKGGEPDWTKDRLNIVASNGLLHDEILEALR